ncbi:MAG: hypothetical protein OIN84_04835, partial [Candidatus Methanoperedens sp.]|nr:hypothetical protein [Candidatus Methanoperedens sp.]
LVANTGTDMTMHVSNISDPTVMKLILKTVKSDEPLPPNAEGVARLEAAVQAAANPEAKPLEALPPIAVDISGHMYRLDETADLLLTDLDLLRLPANDWDMAALGLDFGQGEATLHLQSRSGKDLSIPVGLDGIYRVTTNYLGTVAACGQWLTETNFALYLRRLEQGDVLRYNLTFSNDGLTGNTVRVRRGETGSVNSLTGHLIP